MDEKIESKDVDSVPGVWMTHLKISKVISVGRGNPDTLRHGLLLAKIRLGRLILSSTRLGVGARPIPGKHWCQLADD